MGLLDIKKPDGYIWQARESRVREGERKEGTIDIGTLAAKATRPLESNHPVLTVAS